MYNELCNKYLKENTIKHSFIKKSLLYQKIISLNEFHKQYLLTQILFEDRMLNVEQFIDT